MAPCTVGGLARRMAHGGHIHHENYEFISTEGSAPTSAFSHGRDLRPGDLDPAFQGRHTLKIALSDSIPEFTYIGGLVPSLITSHGQIFHPGIRRPMAHGRLTQGMTSTDHILLGSHETIHIDGSMPVTRFFPIQVNRTGRLGLVVESRPEQRLRY
jgi:hypothetical protein